MAAAAQLAVDNVMTRIESQRQSLIEGMNGGESGECGSGCATDLHDRMLKYKTHMSSQMQTQKRGHWAYF